MKSNRRGGFVSPVKSNAKGGFVSPAKTTMLTPKKGGGRGFVTPVKGGGEEMEKSSMGGNGISPNKQIDSRIIFEYIPDCKSTFKYHDLGNSILKLLFERNEPFSFGQIESQFKDHNEITHLEEILQYLVETKGYLVKIPMDRDNSEPLELYTSITFYKLLVFVNNQEKEEIQRTSEMNSAVKPSTKATVPTTPTKSTENHLSNKRGLKRKSITPGTATPVSDEKKIKPIGVSPSKYNSLESQVDQELLRLEMEKKRLLKSISEKKELIERFKSKGLDNPLKEQEKKQPTPQKEIDISNQIYRWKSATQLAITKLQEKIQEQLKLVENEEALPFVQHQKQQRQRRLSSFRSSSKWTTDDDESGVKEGEEFDTPSEYDQPQYSEDSTEEEMPSVTTKLYFIKSFGIDPIRLNYDEENDIFLPIKK